MPPLSSVQLVVGQQYQIIDPQHYANLGRKEFRGVSPNGHMLFRGQNGMVVEYDINLFEVYALGDANIPSAATLQQRRNASQAYLQAHFAQLDALNQARAQRQLMLGGIAPEPILPPEERPISQMSSPSNNTSVPPNLERINNNLKGGNKYRKIRKSSRRVSRKQRKQHKQCKTSKKSKNNRRK